MDVLLGPFSCQPRALKLQVPWLPGDNLQISSRKPPPLSQVRGSEGGGRVPIHDHLMVVRQRWACPAGAAAFSRDKICCWRNLPRQREGKDLPRFCLAPTSQSSPKPPTGWQACGPQLFCPSKESLGGARNGGIHSCLKIICCLSEIQVQLSVFHMAM